MGSRKSVETEQICSDDVINLKNLCLLWDLWDFHEQTFNLGRLFIGAQGTLGIQTEATLNLVDKSPFEQMIVCAIDSISQLSDVVRTIVGHGASICETFDHHTYELAKDKYPIDAENARFAATLGRG